MNKILVTGAAGFIGGFLVSRLREAGHDVVTVDIENGDVADESTWLKYSSTEVVIHLAGRSFVPDSWADPALFIKCNVLGTVAALNYCKKNNARLIFLSSYLYGKPESLPISENSPLVANNPYALSKKLAEEACVFFSESLGVSVNILRLFNVFGPGQANNFLIPSIIRQINVGQAINVKDLEPKRDYVYIDDVVEAIVKATLCRRKFDTFNIGSGISHSVREIVQIIQTLKGTNLPVYSSAERRKDEIMDTRADITRAKNELGWVPRWGLLRGLEQMLK